MNSLLSRRVSRIVPRHLSGHMHVLATVVIGRASLLLCPCPALQVLEGASAPAWLQQLVDQVSAAAGQAAGGTGTAAPDTADSAALRPLLLTLLQQHSAIDRQRQRLGQLTVQAKQAQQSLATTHWAACQLQKASLALSAALGQKQPSELLTAAAADTCAGRDQAGGSLHGVSLQASRLQPGQLRALVSEHCRLAASAAQRLPEARDKVAHLREELGRQSAKAGASEAVDTLRTQLKAARDTAKRAHEDRRQAQQAAAEAEEGAWQLQRQLEVATGQLEQAVQQGEGLKGRLAQQERQAKEVVQQLQQRVEQLEQVVGRQQQQGKSKQGTIASKQQQGQHAGKPSGSGTAGAPRAASPQVPSAGGDAGTGQAAPAALLPSAAADVSSTADQASEAGAEDSAAGASSAAEATSSTAALTKAQRKAAKKKNKRAADSTGAAAAQAEEGTAEPQLPGPTSAARQPAGRTTSPGPASTTATAAGAAEAGAAAGSSAKDASSAAGDIKVLALNAMRDAQAARQELAALQTSLLHSTHCYNVYKTEL
jgi:hypothetical protein